MIGLIILKANELNFRNVYHKLCYISKAANFKAVMKDWPNSDEATGVIAYGYIDHTAGLTFEVLACASLKENNRLLVFEGNENHSVKYRFESVSDCEIFFVGNENLRKKFADKIEMIDEGYTATDGVLKVRDITMIDECRSQEYPDDVLVILTRGNNQPEGCWVRCEGIKENYIYGILLNEPNADFTVHMGQLVKFGIAKNNDRIICVAVY